jgi:uncharacterized damage-inducible protein DinB
MPGIEMIQTLYAYNDWANQRLFEAAEKVGDDGLMRSALEGQRELRELLFHIVRTEWLWRNLIQSGARPVNPPRLEDMDSLGALRAFAQEEVLQRQVLFAGLKEDDLLTTFQVQDGSGQTSGLVLWHMLLQPIIHGVQHRSEASLILTGLGQSPGDIDFIFFV